LRIGFAMIRSGVPHVESSGAMREDFLI